MPLTPRDRRTLMIGGVILGVLLLGFLVMNVLSGGGEDEAIPSLPPITVEPVGRGRRAERLAVDRGEPDPGVHGPRPVLDPAGALADHVDRDTSVDDQRKRHRDDHDLRIGLDHRHDERRARRSPGGGSSQEVGGKTVVLLSVFSREGEPMVQVEVDGQVFNNVGIGDTFDGGRYELRSVSGNCATFLFGDESFTLCANSTK